MKAVLQGAASEATVAAICWRAHNLDPPTRPTHVCCAAHEGKGHRARAPASNHSGQPLWAAHAPQHNVTGHLQRGVGTEEQATAKSVNLTTGPTQAMHEHQVSDTLTLAMFLCDTSVQRTLARSKRMGKHTRNQAATHCGVKAQVCCELNAGKRKIGSVDVIQHHHCPKQRHQAPAGRGHLAVICCWAPPVAICTPQPAHSR